MMRTGQVQGSSCWRLASPWAGTTTLAHVLALPSPTSVSYRLQNAEVAGWHPSAGLHASGRWHPLPRFLGVRQFSSGSRPSPPRASWLRLTSAGPSQPRPLLAALTKPHQAALGQPPATLTWDTHSFPEKNSPHLPLGLLLSTLAVVWGRQECCPLCKGFCSWNKVASTIKITRLGKVGNIWVKKKIIGPHFPAFVVTITVRNLASIKKPVFTGRKMADTAPWVKMPSGLSVTRELWKWADL